MALFRPRECGTLGFKGTRLPILSQCPNGQSEWHKKRTRPPRHLNIPPAHIKKKKKKGRETKNPADKSRQLKPFLKGNLKSEDRKINKIFQLKRGGKKKNLQMKIYLYAHINTR